MSRPRSQRPHQLNTVRKGDSYEFVFSPFDATYDANGHLNTLSDWTCTIHVRSTPGGSDLITSRSVPLNDKQTGFFGRLLESETDGLDTGTVFLIAEMDNGSKHRERREKITVLEGWQ